MEFDNENANPIFARDFLSLLGINGGLILNRDMLMQVKAQFEEISLVYSLENKIATKRNFPPPIKSYEKFIQIDIYAREA
jgi:hypothetical protein